MPRKCILFCVEGIIENYKPTQNHNLQRFSKNIYQVLLSKPKLNFNVTSTQL